VIIILYSFCCGKKNVREWKGEKSIGKVRKKKSRKKGRKSRKAPDWEI
jgi:hypothetical protein